MSQADNETPKNFTIGDIPEKLIDDLKMLRGLPPHNTILNINRGDGYFSESIHREYGTDMVDAAYRLIINPISEEYVRQKSELDARFAPMVTPPEPS